MPAKDKFHNTVKIALLDDGWTITHDPFPLKDKSRKINYDIDLGAERLLIAEKGTEKIAVEVKSFTTASFSYEFHGVLGQYLIYWKGMQTIAPDRVLFLAIPSFAQERLEEHILIQEIIKDLGVHILVFDEKTEKILKWIK
jgi:XisH protein